MFMGKKCYAQFHKTIFFFVLDVTVIKTQFNLNGKHSDRTSKV